MTVSRPGAWCLKELCHPPHLRHLHLQPPNAPPPSLRVPADGVPPRPWPRRLASSRRRHPPHPRPPPPRRRGPRHHAALPALPCPGPCGPAACLRRARGALRGRNSTAATRVVATLERRQSTVSTFGRSLWRSGGVERVERRVAGRCERVQQVGGREGGEPQTRSEGPGRLASQDSDCVAYYIIWILLRAANKTQCHALVRNFVTRNARCLNRESVCVHCFISF